MMTLTAAVLALLFQLAPSPEELKIRSLLESLGKAMAAKDKEAITARFDVVRMVSEMESRGGVKLLPEGEAERTAALGRIRESLPRMASGMGIAGFGWERIRPLHVREDAKAQEAEAYCSVTIGGSRNKFRFFLSKSEGEWRIYDYEIMEGGVRLSITVGAILAAGAKDAAGGKAMLTALMGLLRAAKSISEGDIDEARASLEKSRQAKPSELILAWVEVFDAQALQLLDRPKEALQAADRALALQKDLALCHQIRAAALQSLNEHEKAIAAAKEFMKLVGDDPDSWHMIAESQLQLKRPDLAKEAYRKGAACDDEEHDNRLALGRILMEEGRKAEAKPYLLAASKNAPPDEGVFEDAAELLDEAGEYATVLEMAEELAIRAPEESEPRLWQGRSLRKLGRLDDAEKLLRKALQDHADDGELVEELVFTLAQAGKDRQALDRAGAKAVGDETEARYLRLFVHATAGRLDQALVELKALLEIDEVVIARADREPALAKFRALEEVVKLTAPARARRSFREAIVKLEDRDWEGRLKLAAAHVKEFPDDDLGWYQQGVALRRLKRFEEAEKSLREAMAKSKHPASTYRSELCRALAAQGKVDSALEETRKFDSESKVDALRARVAVYVIAKKPDEALAALRELLQADADQHLDVTLDDDLEEFVKIPEVEIELKKAKDKN